MHFGVSNNTIVLSDKTSLIKISFDNDKLNINIQKRNLTKTTNTNIITDNQIIKKQKTKN